MTTTNAYDRQPTKFDYASPTQFKFQLAKLPKVEYFTTACNIPGISLGTTLQPTPLADIPLPGDTLSFGDLEITFLVDENLENYREIHGWMTGLGFPKDYSQFRTLQSAGTDRYPTTTNETYSSEIGVTSKNTPDDGGLYSDATLFVLTSKNNSNIEIRFRDVYPISLSGLDYNQQATDVDYLTARVTFQYKIYEFANIGATGTIETTT